MESLPIEKAAIYSNVEIIANGTCYRGKVIRLNSIDGKISLENVEILTDGKAISAVGIQTFFRDDIQSIKFLDEESVLRRMDPNYLLMKPFRKPLHLRGQRIPNDEEILQINRPKSDNPTDPTAAFISPVSFSSRIIDCLDDDFQSAVSMIKAQTAVTVAAEGVLLSRNGELCWLAVGTANDIYLFDIIALGGKAFEGGLADILQSSRILKVIHDCRFFSDYLFHKHHVFLQNVWDTQAARITIYMRHHFGDIPRYVDSLPKALQDALGVDPNDFPFLWHRSYALEKDQSVWRQRPLSDELQQVLEAEVKYLWDLRSVLLGKIIADLSMGVDIYLKAVRDARKSEVDQMVRGKFLVPNELINAANAAKERYAESNATSSIDPLTDCRESMGRMAYWKVRFSRDAWHGKTGVQSAECKEVEDEDTESDPEHVD